MANVSSRVICIGKAPDFGGPETMGIQVCGARCADGVDNMVRDIGRDAGWVCDHSHNTSGIPYIFVYVRC